MAFGYSLAAGDFNCDGNTDLAIGAPLDDPIVGGTLDGIGQVYVRYGTGSGEDLFLPPSAANSVVINADDFPGDGSQAGAAFGFSLYAGNFRNTPDECDHLAIGSPLYDSAPDATDSGRVYIMEGLLDGLTPIKVLDPNIDGSLLDFYSSDGDHFGWSITQQYMSLTHPNLGTFSGQYLAIGAPGATVPVTEVASGLVFFAATGNRIWHLTGGDLENSAGPNVVGQPGDRFGEAVAAGDIAVRVTVNLTTYNDNSRTVLVGVPGTNGGAGAVWGQHGPRTAPNYYLRQGFNYDHPGGTHASHISTGTPSPTDRLGSKIAAVDQCDNDPTHGDIIAITIPGETFAGESTTGAVYWRTRATDHDANEGYIRPPQDYLVPASLTQMDFDQDGCEELVIGYVSTNPGLGGQIHIHQVGMGDTGVSPTSFAAFFSTHSDSGFAHSLEIIESGDNLPRIAVGEPDHNVPTYPGVEGAAAILYQNYSVSLSQVGPLVSGRVEVSSSVSGATSCTNAGLCSEYPGGTSLSIRAIPNPGTGFAFSQWSGACSGQGNPCEISNLDDDISLTASFTDASVLVQAYGGGPGEGHIKYVNSQVGDGFSDCHYLGDFTYHPSSDCLGGAAENQLVTFKVYDVPVGSLFTGWTDGHSWECGGYESRYCSFWPDSNAGAQANFIEVPIQTMQFAAPDGNTRSYRIYEADANLSGANPEDVIEYCFQTFGPGTGLNCQPHQLSRGHKIAIRVMNHGGDLSILNWGSLQSQCSEITTTYRENDTCYLTVSGDFVIDVNLGMVEEAMFKSSFE